MVSARCRVTRMDHRDAVNPHPCTALHHGRPCVSTRAVTSHPVTEYRDGQSIPAPVRFTGTGDDTPGLVKPYKRYKWH